MATSIRPLDYRSDFSVGLAVFLKRAALALALGLSALAFVVMAATAADPDFVPRPAPEPLTLVAT